MQNCKCCSGKTYEECCEPLLTGIRKAETAEELLRSRYCAYANTEIDYIYNSIHPSKREDFDKQSISDWSERSDWHELEIVEVENGGPDDEAGTVEFVAHYSEDGEKKTHHELATFEKEDGEWFFVDGQGVMPKQYVRPEPKVGRNDPCPCGSGKKYKKCCGK